MIKKGILGLIRGYQWLSCYVPRRCRFYPTCSTYMRQALEQFGLHPGVILGLTRLLRCHPFHPGGVDPIPKGVSKTKGVSLYRV